MSLSDFAPRESVYPLVLSQHEHISFVQPVDYSWKYSSETERKFVTENVAIEQSPGGIQVRSMNNEGTLSIWLEELYQNSGYIVLWEIYNKKEIPPVSFVDNPYLKRPETQMKLTQSGENMLIVPPNPTGLFGYSLTLHARGSPLFFTLSDVQIIPFHYYVAQSVKIDVDNTLSNSQTIYTNNQSFHTGWLAYDLTDANWLQRKFPFIFAEKLRLKNHFLINNWANGWVVLPQSSVDSRQSSENNTHAVRIVFWPQYLEYIGIFITIISTVLAFGYWASERAVKAAQSIKKKV